MVFVKNDFDLLFRTGFRLARNVAANNSAAVVTRIETTAIERHNLDECHVNWDSWVIVHLKSCSIR